MLSQKTTESLQTEKMKIWDALLHTYQEYILTIADGCLF